MTRFRIFVLLATIAALGTALAACGGGGGDSEDPQKTIESATVEGVESGTVDLKLGIKSEGAKGGDLDLSLSGPFQAGAGKESLPEFDMAVKADGTVEGEDVNFEGGLTLLSDRAFVGFKGDEYEVDPTTFGFVKSGFEQAAQEGGSEAESSTACQEAATSSLKVGEFVDNLKSEGGAEVDGVDTTKVSGDLNTKGAVDAVIKLTENPACSSQLEAAGQLPLAQLEEAKGELSSAIKDAHVDVYVGEDDNIIRRVTTTLTIEPKGTSSEKVEIDFDLTLGEVNEEQEIAAPTGAKPLEGLFQQLGVNPLDLLEGISGGGGGGTPDIGGLLEGLMEGTSGSSESSSSGSAEAPPGGSAGSVAGQQAYLECLKTVKTPTDLQQCASMLK